MLRIGDAGCQVGDQDGVRTAEQLAPTLGWDRDDGQPADLRLWDGGVARQRPTYCEFSRSHERLRRTVAVCNLRLRRSNLDA